MHDETRAYPQRASIGRALGDDMAIARIALPVAAEATFDYWIPEGLVVERGALVRVRLARRSLTGVVVDVAPSTDVPRDKLQPIDELRSEIPPLPADVLE